ncbi:Alpha-1,3 1,6-mannosyltransferase ALG2 [Pelobates cultripes]|uniref:Alpha-1,3/1,6-mannosyltransferase ALG2 n=1 Tax=Pelobates cultripes TaxID=61616 RepID=A0AAD1W4W0_PELCU|nr:Alpha-1,3 1,6-mannosyltransferase ALG2 [Pelobates cultripes]
MADCILVNSHFTANVFKQTFASLSHREIYVLYPSLNISKFESNVFEDLSNIVPMKRKHVFLSVNRYERKKNLDLALKAFCDLRDRLNMLEWEKVHLIIAGGYDERVKENVEHFQELHDLTAQLGIGDHVTFLRSFSDEQKLNLLYNCICVLYTPSNEHFGIVPIEAMYMRSPVIAVNSGGPLESVVNNVTGYLCQPQPHEFCDAMERFVKNPSLKITMGKAGHARVLETFSFEAFSSQIYHHICKLTQCK